MQLFLEEGGGVNPKKFLLRGGGSCEKIGKLRGVIQLLNGIPPNPTSPPYPLKNERSLKYFLYSQDFSSTLQWCSDHSWFDFLPQKLTNVWSEKHESNALIHFTNRCLLLVIPFKSLLPPRFSDNKVWNISNLAIFRNFRNKTLFLPTVFSTYH